MENDNHFRIGRFSPEGHIECTGLFKSTLKNIDLKIDYAITYPSHCATVTIIQEDKKITFKNDQKNQFKHT